MTKRFWFSVMAALWMSIFHAHGAEMPAVIARPGADNGHKQAGDITPSITLPDWTIENWNTKSLSYALAPGFEHSGYAFEFTAVRDVQHYIFKVILPLVLIVIMSCSGFWIDPVNANSQ